MKYKNMYTEDLFKAIYDYFQYKKNGFYIEAGANDGVHNSNTKLLQDRNDWSGILIEPNYEIFKQLQKNRPNNLNYNCALVDTNYQHEKIQGYFNSSKRISLFGKIVGVEGNEEALKNEIINSVNALKLKDIIKDNNIETIDFFSLDVEGYEIQVLNGLDLNCNRPEYILVEAPITDKRCEEMQEYMKYNNYDFISQITNNDQFYKKKEK